MSGGLEERASSKFGGISEARARTRSDERRKGHLSGFACWRSGKEPEARREAMGEAFAGLDKGRLGEGFLLQGGEVICLGLRPIDHRPNGFEVIGAAVLIVEIIGVFPDIDSEDWGAFDSCDCFAHQGVILVGG